MRWCRGIAVHLYVEGCRTICGGLRSRPTNSKPESGAQKKRRPASLIERQANDTVKEAAPATQTTARSKKVKSQPATTNTVRTATTKKQAATAPVKKIALKPAPNKTTKATARTTKPAAAKLLRPFALTLQPLSEPTPDVYPFKKFFVACKRMLAFTDFLVQNSKH